MTDQTNIDYKVKQAKKYEKVKGYGYKQLSKINQKASEFQFGSQQERFEIELEFKPALVSTIEFKVKSTNQISFDMINKGERVCNFQSILSKQQIGVFKTKFIKLEDQAQIFDRVVITFLNYDRPKKTIINYIFLKGFKQDNDKKVHKVKNVSQKDEFELPSKKKVTDQDKKLFNTRNKERPTPPDQLVEEVIANKLKDVKKQEEQMLRIIELSRKEHQRHLKQRKEDDVVQIFPGPADEEQNFQEFFQYDVVQYEKVKNVFEHVTPEWIQAQRKAEYNLSIQNRHSLADKIKIKIFKQENFCVNNISGEVKSRLVEAIKNLGGKIVQQPTNRCIVVTNRMQGGKINLAKTLTGVKFVKPNYVHDCQKMKIKIEDIQQYKPS